MNRYSAMILSLLFLCTPAGAKDPKYPHRIYAGISSAPYVNAEIVTQAEHYYIDSLIPLGITASYEYKLLSYLSVGAGAGYYSYIRYGDSACHAGHGITAPVFIRLIATLPRSRLEYFLELGGGFSFLALKAGCDNDKSYPGLGYEAHGAIGARFWEWEHWAIWFDLRILVTAHHAGDRTDETDYYPTEAMLLPAVNIGMAYRF
jgi:hypothetical protein